MNTEFPSRIPTVVQNTSTNTGSTTTSTTDSSTKSFRDQLISIFKSVIDNLHKISDSIINFFKSGPSRSTQPARPTSDVKRDEKDRAERTSFYQRVARGFTALNDVWHRGIDSLRMTVDQTAMSLGSAIGGVFGRGVFGNLITKAITSALKFAVSKILIGMVLSHLPTIAIIGAIIAAIYILYEHFDEIVGAIKWLGTQIWDGITYVAEQVWEGIKWVGHAFDQAINSIIDILPWTKSKYTKAQEGLAEKSGISEKIIKAYYGDSVSGRDRMLEDWRKAQEDEAYMNELKRKFTTKKGEYDAYQQDFINLVMGKPRTGYNMSLIQEVQQTNLPDYFRNPEDKNMSMIGEDLYGDTAIVAPVVNSTNAALDIPNFFGSNVSMMYPMSSINNEWNLNYSPIGSY